MYNFVQNVNSLRERKKKYCAEWKKKYPERAKAHYEVAKAVKSGILKKAAVCENCHHPRPRVSAYHPDYSKPLEVVWLCQTCHLNEHGVYV